MSFQETLYAFLPVLLQNAACSLEGLRIVRRRYSRAFERVLGEYESRTFLSPEEVMRFRDARLQEFLSFCSASVPFYGDRSLPSANAAVLTDFPVLNKAEVQENYEHFRPTNVELGSVIRAHTSGTTGGGLKFTTTVAAMHDQWAVWWRYRGWQGIDRNTWCGYFAGRSVVPVRTAQPPFWRYNHPARQILFSGYHMSNANLRHYIAELRRRRPLWLHGYPSLLSLIASYLLDSKETLDYQVRWITTGAENLLLQQLELIREAFGVTPLQHYGMAEGVANISQCPNKRLHIDEDYSAVELVSIDATTFRIVGTNFTNRATPLIRYDTGDVATVTSAATCSCGRPGRVVDAIDGRQEDYIVLPNGTRLGRLDHIFKDLVMIREAQVYQKSAGAVTFRIVPRAGYSQQDEAALLREARQRLGSDIHISIEYHNALEHTATGKLQFVISEVAPLIDNGSEVAPAVGTKGYH